MPELKKGLYYSSVEDENADDERVRRQNHNKMIVKTIIVLFLIIPALAVALGSGDSILSELGLGHPPAGEGFKTLDTDIDISYDPLQAPYKGASVIINSKNYYHFLK